MLGLELGCRLLPMFIMLSMRTTIGLPQLISALFYPIFGIRHMPLHSPDNDNVREI